MNFDLVTLFSNIINGLTFGSIYALFALGLVLIYRISEVVNFGLGQMAMFCAYICFGLLYLLLHGTSGEPLPDSIAVGPFLIALVGTLVFAGVLGLTVERTLMRPLRTASPLNQVLVTVGLGVLLYGLVSLLWQADLKNFSQLEFLNGPPILASGSIIITREVIAALSISLLVSSSLFLFFKFTKMGKAMRAMAEDAATASLMGINTERLTGVVWLLAVGLAALAAILTAPKISLSPNLMDDVAIKAFAAAVLGGITSLAGAVIGGLLLGIISNLLDYYLPGYSLAVSFVIIVVVLSWRPAGLLGSSPVLKV